MVDQNTVISVVSGATASIAIVKLFGRSLLNNLFAKDLEAFKAELTKDNSIKLEEVKSNFLLEAKKEERNHNLTLSMKRYKSPLLHASNDLQSRLFNITCQGLCECYGHSGNTEHRDYIVNNTAFLFSQYFAWVEIIRREIQFIELDNMESVRELSELIDSIYSIFQSNSYDQLLFIWAGDQRGIGELLIEERDNGLTCMGYAKFLNTFENSEQVLFSSLKTKVNTLVDSPVNHKTRLVKLQHSLIDLMFFLDPTYIRFPENKRHKVLDR